MVLVKVPKEKRDFGLFRPNLNSFFIFFSPKSDFGPIWDPKKLKWPKKGFKCIFRLKYAIFWPFILRIIIFKVN